MLPMCPCPAHGHVGPTSRKTGLIMSDYLINILVLSATPVLYVLITTLVLAYLVLPWVKRAIWTKKIDKPLKATDDSWSPPGIAGLFLSNYAQVRNTTAVGGCLLALAIVAFTSVHAANTLKANSFDSQAYSQKILAGQFASQASAVDEVDLGNVATPEDAGISDEDYERMMSFGDGE